MHAPCQHACVQSRRFSGRANLGLQVDKKAVTHNTDFFRFALPDSEQPLGLPVASCLLVR